MRRDRFDPLTHSITMLTKPSSGHDITFGDRFLNLEELPPQAPIEEWTAPADDRSDILNNPEFLNALEEWFGEQLPQTDSTDPFADADTSPELPQLTDSISYWSDAEGNLFFNSLAGECICDWQTLCSKVNNFVENGATDGMVDALPLLVFSEEKIQPQNPLTQQNNSFQGFRVEK